MPFTAEARGFLDRLMATPGPAGFEAAAQHVVRDYLFAHLPESASIQIDRNDNLIATVRPGGGSVSSQAPSPRPSPKGGGRIGMEGPSRPGPHVALLGHIDTVGLMVSSIEPNGTLRVSMVGRPRAESLVGQLVTVHARGELIPGVVFRVGDGEKKAEVADLAVDCGFATTPSPLRGGGGPPIAIHRDWGPRSGQGEPSDGPAGLIRPGDYVTWAAPPRELADGRLVGPGADDRLGVFAACQTLLAAADLGEGGDGRGPQSRRNAIGDPGPTVSAVSCIQEEGPTHLGAITTMSRLRPDLIVIIDTTSAGDACGTGGSGGAASPFKLGGGPIIARGGSVHNRTSDALLQLAESMAIPFQIEPVSRDSGTDLESAIQFAGGQAVGCLVSIPQRHIHTPNEVFDPADVELTIQLLSKFIATLPQGL